MDALYSFIGQHLVYPPSAREQKITGTVLIEFVVEKEGSVGKVTVKHGVDKMLDNEAVRVIQMLPDWTPGKVNGKPVSCYYSIPIRFAIN